MKNFNTRLFSLLAALCLVSGALAQPLTLSPDAPDKHVVVRGDTLWAISGRFLDKPWRWPELWQLNREQIRNPHLIYPGDIVYLDRSGDRPRLRLGRAIGASGADSGDEGADADAAAGLARDRLSPRVRATPLPRAPIPTISASSIEAFLSRPLVVDAQGLQNHPRIVAAAENRVYMARDDQAWVRGAIDPAIRDWHVYRAATPLLDPDTRLPIAWEAQFVGSARLEREGDPALFRITGATEELGIGDRLMPADRSRIFSYAPHAPDTTVRARVLAIYRGVAQAGRNSVVAINAGTAQGLEVGHVLEIRQNGRLLKDREAQQVISLAGEPIGHLLVFRLFDSIAYGLILDASQPVSLGDVVVNP